MSRRQFLRRTAYVGGGLTLAYAFGRLADSLIAGDGDAIADDLVDFDQRTAVRRGFEVRAISPVGSVMDDGVRVPELHDGMGCFAGEDGGYTLVRNHEISEFDRSQRPDMAWDPACRGGTTTVRLDADLRLQEHYLSLTGTLKNCAGGVMPWGSWLSCEEKFSERNGVRHGYVFEVDHRRPNLSPRPLRAMGRFEHEACAFDPEHGHVYMTEDRPDGNLYRFLPAEPGNLSAGGRLQALGLTPMSDEAFACHWIDVDDPDPADDTIRARAQALGAAGFARPEGLWLDSDGIYFSATAGGARGLGEIFHYRPQDADSGTLQLVFESGDQGPVQPDALLRLPGGVMLVCEDSSRDQSHILGLTPDGRWFTFARGDGVIGWTGITLSPDGRVLFVNQQYIGRTLAITGDWDQLAQL